MVFPPFHTERATEPGPAAPGLCTLTFLQTGRTDLESASRPIKHTPQVAGAPIPESLSPLCAGSAAIRARRAIRQPGWPRRAGYLCSGGGVWAFSAAWERVVRGGAPVQPGAAPLPCSHAVAGGWTGCTAFMESRRRWSGAPTTSEYSPAAAAATERRPLVTCPSAPPSAPCPAGAPRRACSRQRRLSYRVAHVSADRRPVSVGCTRPRGRPHRAAPDTQRGSHGRWHDWRR